MNAELSEIKYIDEKNNEYIIGALSDYNNERYGLMINIHNPIDFFIAKIINSQDSIELEKVKDSKKANEIMNDLVVIE